MLPMVVQANRNLRCEAKLSVGLDQKIEIEPFLLCSLAVVSIKTDLKKMGWSVNEEAEDSLSVDSSLPEVEKPLRFIPLGAGTEMIGAGSWLGPTCLEKLQENSGGAAFLVLTQTAHKTIKGLEF